jgi:hypothetical protein
MAWLDSATALLAAANGAALWRLWATGNYNQYELAKQYGVAQPTISDIVNGRTL